VGTLASREVRWFFDDNKDNSRILREWIDFDPTGKFPAKGIWKGDLGDREDLYAVIPNANDMGMKWREGELQIKGRRVDCGVQYFGNAVFGRVEEWLKWSYKGESVEAAFRPWFNADGSKGPQIVAVAKRRALRKIRIDAKGASHRKSPRTISPIAP
jgi:hypothetical protein